MKAFFSALYFLIIVFSVQQTQAQGSGLSIFSENQNPFYLFLNNELINEFPTNSISKSNLILKDYNLVIKWKDIHQERIETIIKLKPGAVRAFTIVLGKKGFEIEELSTSKKNTQLSGTPSLIASKSSYQGPVGCKTPSSNSEANQLEESLKRMDYPQDKVVLIKESLPKGCFRVDQLVQFLKVIDYESEQVEVAKYAYSFIYDRGNYSQIASIFEYPNAYDEITKYIKSQPSFY